MDKFGNINLLYGTPVEGATVDITIEECKEGTLNKTHGFYVEAKIKGDYAEYTGKPHKVKSSGFRKPLESEIRSAYLLP